MKQDPDRAAAVDYILGITREIWEDRGLGPALRRHYAEQVLLRHPGGVLVGNEAVIAATLQTLHEFPDRRLLGEDVIWQSAGEDGFFSSHRVMSVMTHKGDGVHGKATGKPVRARAIAECVVRDGQVVEEWLARDEGAIASCLGLSAEEQARRLVEHELRRGGKVEFFTPETDLPGDYANVVDDSEEASAYIRDWQALWGEQALAALGQRYHEGACVFAPGGATLNGHDETGRFIISYLAAFPGATFEAEHLLVNREPTPRLAMRWRLRGRHEGWGRFGPPTGAPAHVMGLTHANLVDGKTAMEWIIIDETAVWKQIIAHERGLPRGPAPSGPASGETG